jgi:hypothetical protein
MDWRLKGIVLCPACERMKLQSEWKVHKKRELTRRKVRKSDIYKSADGQYKCIVRAFVCMGRIQKSFLLQETLDEALLRGDRSERARSRGKVISSSQYNYNLDFV